MTSQTVSADVEDRRLLRKHYRDVNEMIQANMENISAVPSVEFQQAHRVVNELFDEANNVRELALDATALSELSKAVKSQAVKLGDLSSSFNLKNMINHLRNHYCNTNLGHDMVHSVDDGYFDWTGFGRDVGVLFMSIPRWSVMHGPIKKEVVVKRKQAARRTKNDESEEDEENKGTVETQVEEGLEEATTARIMKLEELLSSSETATSAATKPSKSLSSLLVDTVDPVQTIENFFDMSFLVKGKKLSLTQDSKGELWMHPDDLAGELTKQQKVLTLNMATIRAMGEKLQSQSAVTGVVTNQLHRDDALYHANTVQEQLVVLEQMLNSKKREHDNQTTKTTTTTSTKKSRKSE